MDATTTATAPVQAGLITPQEIDSDIPWAEGPSQLELIQTHYRTPAQVPYRLPAGSVGINISAVLADLVDDLCEGSCCTSQAIKKFDELLGLCSSNIKSFTEEYCPEHDGLFDATKNFLCAVAGHIAKSHFDESENVSQDSNGGILAAARFLAPYVYVVNGNDQAIFLPEGQISYAYQRAGLWQESLPRDHRLQEWETGQAGKAVFEAMVCQLRRLSEVETSVQEGTRVTFWQSSIQVQYGAHFSADASTERGTTQKSKFVLADQEMNEQIQTPEPVWDSFAKQFGERSFVSWQIDEGFETQRQDLRKAYGAEGPVLQIHDADTWTPLFTSALVLTDTEVPVIVTVSDVYGNAKVFHSTLTIKNNINERPLPEIAVKRSVKAGEEITATVKGILDNPDDKEHDVKWIIYTGTFPVDTAVGGVQAKNIVAIGTGDKITFIAPGSTTETKIKVRLIVGDRHTENNTGTKEATIKVSPLKIAAPSGPPTEVKDPVVTSLREKTDLSQIFGTEVREIEKEKVEEEFPDAVIEAITLPQQVKFYDLTFLVDSSGSMHTKLAYLKPQITEIINTLKSQVIQPGMIRINFFTYGKEQTNMVGNGIWVDASQLTSGDFTSRLDATIKYVSENNLDLETAWYTVWDLYEGPSQRSWQKPEDKEGEYEHRMVILSDEEVESAENVVKIPKMSRRFDKTEAEAFVSRHPNASLRIIELSSMSKAECEKQRRDILRVWTPEAVVYDPTKDISGMSYIPGRSYLRGGCENPNEGPLSIVKEDALYMDQAEMTNAEYARIMKDLDGKTVIHRGKEITIDATPSRKEFDGPQQPVVDVSWYHADLACERQDKRLPTESEWENAAKGPDGTLEYPTNDGSEPSNQNNNANFYADSRDSDGTSDVGIYPEGPYGLEDMAGNVWEWTSDWYASSYDTSSLENPTGLESGQYRVVRGGSWSSDAQYLRSANRGIDGPGYSDDGLGFRCVQ